MENEEFEKENDVTQNHGIQKCTKNKKNMNIKFYLYGLITVMVVTMGLFIAPQLHGGLENKSEIITLSTLEKIVNVRELSTFQAVYNGITKVMNDIKPEQLDYYVSYKAKVNAGFDFEKIKINLEDKSKKIIVTIPQIVITEVNVDIASLDYIFLNDKANKSTVSVQAYKVCIADVTNESKEESKIYDLAAQNAKNIMKALISPFIEQLDSDYELEIILGGV